MKFYCFQADYFYNSRIMEYSRDFTDEEWAEQRKREARARGLLFEQAKLEEILKMWALALDTDPARKPFHNAERLSLPVAGGGTVHITETRIVLEGGARENAEAYRATMLHIASEWGGKGFIHPMAANNERDEIRNIEFRLRSRAYAEVYGIELHDRNPPLTAQQLAKLPMYRAFVRDCHADAPPKRPDEEATLAAMYAARQRQSQRTAQPA